MRAPTPAAPAPPTHASAYRDRAVRAVLVLAAATAAVRLPLVSLPPTPDEGGLLMVGGQWSPGRSLYGNYWVDRPPLLVAFFGVADQLGGVVALRVLGAVLVAGSVVLGGLLAHLAVGSGRSGPRPDHARLRAVGSAATVAAVLLCQPRFGAFEVDGEIVATPLVLGGFVLVLTAARVPSALRARAALAGAGACAAAAALVKQNELDVFVLLAVAAPTLLRGSVATRGRVATTAGAGALAVVGATLVVATRRGTHLPALWDAVVTFRLHASAVIAQSASSATHDRFRHLLLAGLLSGVPLLVARWARGLPQRRRPGSLDLRWPSAAVLAWETCSVLGGGSYWQHYLICLVPGLVLAEAVRGTVVDADARPPWALAALTAACLLPLAPAYADAVARPEGHDPPATTWLRDRVRPGDTAVVAYGHADLLQATGLSSPYPELWSLPVRVRDPRLARLARVLWSHRRPDWILTGPQGLSGWGIDAGAAQTSFRAFYRPVADLGSVRVFRLRDEARPRRPGG